MLLLSLVFTGLCLFMAVAMMDSFSSVVGPLVDFGWQNLVNFSVVAFIDP